MENKGFKNAPGVMQFAVGMRVKNDRQDYWKIVAWVNGTRAHCRCDDGSHDTAAATLIEQYTLDLSSVWIGREYRARTGERHRSDATVRAVCGYMVGFVQHWGNVDHCWNRDSFLRHYEPLPLDPPATPEPYLCGDCLSLGNSCTENMTSGRKRLATDHGDEKCFRSRANIGKTATPEPVQEAWKPTVGGNCFYDNKEHEGRFAAKIRGVDEEHGLAWIVRADCHPYDDGMITETVNLRPLPPKPPVTNGEVYCIRECGNAYYGIATEIARNHPTTFVLTSAGYRQQFDWTKVGITHLVPADANKESQRQVQA